MLAPEAGSHVGGSAKLPGSGASPTDDLVSKSYWDSVVQEQGVPDPIDPADRRLRNHLNREFDQMFRAVFATERVTPKRVLEVGCARSRWLPYFATQFGSAVSGLDYSQPGCSQARAVLQKADVPGEIVCGDLFSPPPDMLGSFDLVVSFGVVEHFTDTVAVVKRLAGFAKPGGLVITVIPNLTGLVGAAMREINRTVYEHHVLMDPHMLRATHEGAGLEVTAARYFAVSNFRVVNLNGLRRGTVSWVIKRAFSAMAIGLTGVIWTLEEAGARLPTTQRVSPYVLCVARKPPVR